MKKFSGFLILLGIVILGAIGCPSNNNDNPTSPAVATNTPTITPTPLATSTPTNTGTHTATHTASGTPTDTGTSTQTSSPTNTATHTATATVTNTATLTATATITDTPTDSPTASATRTPTHSPTQTATATPTNTPLYLSLYTFESGLNGWAWDAGVGGSTSGLSSAQAHGGAQSAGVTCPAASGTENFRIDFPSPQNLTGKVISFWLYVDSPTFTQVSIFTQQVGYSVYDDGIYHGLTFNNLNHWVQYTYIPGNQTGSDLTQVNDIAIQVSSNGSGTGHAYIDDITIAPAPHTWDFDNGQPAAWDYGAVPGGVSVSPLTISAPGGTGNSTTYALTLPAGPFTAINQSLQVQYTYYTHNGPSGNWTAMGFSSIMADVMVDADISNNGSQGVQLFIQSGPGYHFENNGYTNLTAGTWTHITFTPTFSGGGDPTNVRWFGIQFSTGNAGTAWGAANLKVDNIELQ